MSGYSLMRPHTLDLLAQYIDYQDYEHFCQQQEAESEDRKSQDVTNEEEKKKG